MIKFGTDGWRAIIADDFTYENVRYVSLAIARYLKSQKPKPYVLVGYDGRFMGEDFAEAVAGALTAEGLRVVRGTEPCPTPTLAYAVKAKKADGAVMLTASHNPYYYNGLKFIPDYAGPATADITLSIEKNLARIMAERANPKAMRKDEAKTVKTDLSREYASHIRGFINRKTIAARGLKVVLDPFHGAGYKLLPELSQALGIKTVAIRDSLDPLFEGGYPDPTSENLKRLRDTVRLEKGDAGLALDGDADRFGIVSENGRFMSPNMVSALVLQHMVKNRGAEGAVVRTIATTHLIDRIAQAYGLELIETPVGFKHIGKIMRERPVVLGGEESGGLSVLGHIPEKDGLLADLLIAEMLAAENMPLSVVWKNLVNEYGTFYNQRLDIRIGKERQEELIEGLSRKPPAYLGGLKVCGIDRFDGLRFSLERGAWLLARPSGTEPLVRIYIEALDQADWRALKGAAGRLICR